MNRPPLPPSNNMGAQITNVPSRPFENQVLIDWLSWTLKTCDPHTALAQSGLDSLPFTPCDFGGMGYRKSMRSGNIVIYYDGAENMGCHISMTGQGCRQYEMYKRVEHCWYQLLLLLTANSATITRMDIANDNVDGALDLRRLEWNIRKKRVRSLFKGGQKIEKFSFAEDAKKQGKTIYLGSPTSRLKIRFYDKAAQYEIDEHWIRSEIQLMSERAQEAAKLLMSGFDIGKIFTGVLNHYFTVINLDDSNKTRCSIQTWWQSWLQSTEKIKLTTMKAIRLVDEVMDHIKRQYSASIAMCRKFLGVAGFHDFVADLVDTGKGKMSKKHAMIIQCSQLVTELPF